MRNDDGTLDELITAMFPHDARGRLIGDSPRVHILRTAETVVCRVHESVPDATLTNIVKLAIAPRGRPTAWAEDYANYVSLIGDVATVVAIRAGPLFGFPEFLPHTSDCVVVDPGNVELLRGSFDEWIEDVEDAKPMVIALADGRAASVCATVRAAGTVQCAGVETAPACRGRGLAARAVGAWASLVRARGSEPFYATTFDNLSSQNVARRLRLRLLGSEFSIYGAALPSRVR